MNTQYISTECGFNTGFRINHSLKRVEVSAGVSNNIMISARINAKNLGYSIVILL
jgi:hypothetical protein